MKNKQKKKSNKRLLVLLTVLVFLLVGFLVVMTKREEIATNLAIKYYGGSSQCVGYVQRYYRNMFDVEIKNVGRAQNLFSMAGDFGLYAHQNGGRISPQPGDILVFGNRNRVGHLSIITEVLDDGVRIIEQNWGTSAITTNGNRPLKMETSNGKFSIEDRESYWVIGWVSRTDKNPGKFFFFPQGDAEGWYPDGNVLTEENNPDGFKLKVIGKSPMIASPVFIAGNAVENPKKIEMRGKIQNENGQKGVGHLFLRDQSGNWSEDISFGIDANNTFQVHSINLDNLPEGFKITQMRLQLNDNPQIRKESWIVSWIQIY